MENASWVNCEGKWSALEEERRKTNAEVGVVEGGEVGGWDFCWWSDLAIVVKPCVLSHVTFVQNQSRSRRIKCPCFRTRWQARMAGGVGLLVHLASGTNVREEDTASGRQIFVPTNLGTNTFVFDTVSFLSILTLAVFLVRVFSRVIRWERRRFFLILGYFLVTKDKVCSQLELIQKGN